MVPAWLKGTSVDHVAAIVVDGPPDRYRALGRGQLDLEQPGAGQDRIDDGGGGAARGLRVPPLDHAHLVGAAQRLAVGGDMEPVGEAMLPCDHDGAVALVAGTGAAKTGSSGCRRPGDSPVGIETDLAAEQPVPRAQGVAAPHDQALGRSRPGAAKQSEHHRHHETHRRHPPADPAP